MYSSSYDSIVTQMNNVCKIASGIQIREWYSFQSGGGDGHTRSIIW